ncbi:MAG: succinate dehydrogenase cytochrome b subunit [Catalinimonas sp.]
MRTTLLRKNLMALSGLFLVLFLVVHLVGNLQLLVPPGELGGTFNRYAYFMTSQPIIKAVSYLLYASIVLHVVLSVYITLRNRRAARASGAYAYDRRGAASPWYARSMGWLGLVVLVFLVIHLRDFWYVYKFEDLGLDVAGDRDLYTLVIAAFGRPLYVLFYVVAALALGFHLLHGVASAFKTLGAYPPRLYRLLYGVSVGLTALLTLGFAALPVWVYLNYHL